MFSIWSSLIGSTPQVSCRLSPQAVDMSYSSGTCPTVLSHVLQFWDMSYSSEPCPTVLGHILQFWDTSYSSEPCPTVLGHVLQFWDISYVVGMPRDIRVCSIPLSGVVRLWTRPTVLSHVLQF